jgi:hypothetical protein
MPCGEQTPMSERLAFVEEYRRGLYSMTALCTCYGITQDRCATPARAGNRRPREAGQRCGGLSGDPPSVRRNRQARCDSAGLRCPERRHRRALPDHPGGRGAGEDAGLGSVVAGDAGLASGLRPSYWAPRPWGAAVEGSSPAGYSITTRINTVSNSVPLSR